MRCYLGYDLHEPLPDHSSLTRIRERYGIQIFRHFFEAIVDRCAEDGLIWGQQLFADATLAEANADRDKMLPRFAYEAHLKRLFGDAYLPPGALESTTAMASGELVQAVQPEVALSAPELGVERAAERAAALMPLPEWHKRSKFFATQVFSYDPASDSYRCPKGEKLRRVHHDVRNQADIYQAESSVCAACPLRAKCTDSKAGCSITRSFYEEYLERVGGYHETAAYEKAYQKRKLWVKPLVGEAQQWHGLRRFRLRGLEKVNYQGVITATGQNLKPSGQELFCSVASPTAFCASCLAISTGRRIMPG